MSFLPFPVTALQLLTVPQEPSPCGVACAGGPAPEQGPGLGPSPWVFHLYPDFGMIFQLFES